MNPAEFYTSVEPTAICLRTKQAAAALGVSESHLGRLTKAGEIPTTKIGDCRVYPVDGLRAWLTSQIKGGSNVAH